jgi:hypothetical protein
MQAILAAEKAGLQAGGQSPAGGQAGAGARLSVLQKELEGSITKLHCRQVYEMRGLQVEHSMGSGSSSGHGPVRLPG